MEKIQRENWVSRFELVGKPKINEYTFKINEKSDKSAWMYNAMSLYVDCGEKFGDVACEMMGGYSSEGNSFIYAHGKDENGKDDFSEQSRITVAWEDRLNKNILETIGESCFFTVGIEKDKEDKTYYKKFLSEFDAIAYIKEHIDENMVLRIKGDLNYSLYNDNVVVKKKVRSIVLSKIDNPNDFKAEFTQSVLLDKSSVNAKDIDKATGILPVYGTVLDYVKEINGTEIKGFYPMQKVFDYQLDLENEKQCSITLNKILKVKKGYTQVNFVGHLIENSTVTITYDDLPDEIKELVDGGIYPLEEALTKCTANKNKDKRMVLLKPEIKMEGKEGNKAPRIMRFEDTYSEEELIFEIADNSEEVNESSMSDTSDDTGNEMDWLKNL